MEKVDDDWERANNKLTSEGSVLNYSSRNVFNPDTNKRSYNSLGMDINSNRQVYEDMTYPLQNKGDIRYQLLHQSPETNIAKLSASPRSESLSRLQARSSESQVALKETQIKSPRVVISFEYGDKIDEVKKEKLARAVENVLNQDNDQEDIKPIKLQEPPKYRYKQQFRVGSNPHRNVNDFHCHRNSEYDRQPYVVKQQDDYDDVDGLFDDPPTAKESMSSRDNVTNKRHETGKVPRVLKDGTVVPNFTKAKRPSIVIDETADEVGGDLEHSPIRRTPSSCASKTETRHFGDSNSHQQTMYSAYSGDSVSFHGLLTTGTGISRTPTNSSSYMHSPSSDFEEESLPSRRTFRSFSDIDFRDRANSHDLPRAARRDQRSASQPVNVSEERRNVGQCSSCTGEINKFRSLAHGSGLPNTDLEISGHHRSDYQTQAYEHQLMNNKQEVRRHLFDTSRETVQGHEKEVSDRCIPPIPDDIKQYLISKNMISSTDIRNLEHGIPLRSKPSHSPHSQTGPHTSRENKYQVVLLPRDDDTPTTHARHKERLSGASGIAKRNVSEERQIERLDTEPITDSHQRWSSFAQSSMSDVPFDGSRKRKRGDIDLRIQCVEELDQAHEQFANSATCSPLPSRQCNCEEIENHILRMAREAYTKIRRTDDSVESFQKFEKELHDTNSTIIEAIKVKKVMATVCAHGRQIENIYNGSIIFTVNCPTLLSLEELWENYTSGDLQKTIQDGFVTDDLRRRFGNDIYLSVVINEYDYLSCKREMVTTIGRQTLPRSKKTSKNITNYKENQSVFFPESFVYQNRSQSAPELSPEKSASNVPPSPGFMVAKNFAFSLSLSGSPIDRYEQEEESPQSPRKKFFADVGNVPQEIRPHTPKSPLSPIN